MKPLLSLLVPSYQPFACQLLPIASLGSSWGGWEMQTTAYSSVLLMLNETAEFLAIKGNISKVQKDFAKYHQPPVPVKQLEGICCGWWEPVFLASFARVRVKGCFWRHFGSFEMVALLDWVSADPRKFYRSNHVTQDYVVLYDSTPGPLLLYSSRNLWWWSCSLFR